MATIWKTLEFRSHTFHRSLAVALTSNGNGDLAVQTMLELAPFHDHIYTTGCYRWLDLHGTHRIRGCARVQQIGSIIFPGVVCSWSPGQKFKESETTSEAPHMMGRVDIDSRFTMVNIPWLMAYVLLVTQTGKANKRGDPVSRATELLELITSLPKLELHMAISCGGTLVIDKSGVAA